MSLNDSKGKRGLEFAFEEAMDIHEAYKLNITHHMQVYVDEDVSLKDRNKNMES